MQPHTPIDAAIDMHMGGEVQLLAIERWRAWRTAWMTLSDPAAGVAQLTVRAQCRRHQGGSPLSHHVFKGLQHRGALGTSSVLANQQHRRKAVMYKELADHVIATELALVAIPDQISCKHRYVGLPTTWSAEDSMRYGAYHMDDSGSDSHGRLACLQGGSA